MNLALYCNVAEAAQLAGITPAYVRLMLARGQLRGDKVGRDWLVLREDVARFVKIGRGPAAPAARPRRPAAKTAKKRRSGRGK